MFQWVTLYFKDSKMDNFIHRLHGFCDLNECKKSQLALRFGILLQFIKVRIGPPSIQRELVLKFLLTLCFCSIKCRRDFPNALLCEILNGNRPFLTSQLFCFSGLSQSRSRLQLVAFFWSFYWLALLALFADDLWADESKFLCLFCDASGCATAWPRQKSQDILVEG